MIVALPSFRFTPIPFIFPLARAHRQRWLLLYRQSKLIRKYSHPFSFDGNTLHLSSSINVEVILSRIRQLPAHFSDHSPTKRYNRRFFTLLPFYLLSFTFLAELATGQIQDYLF